MSQVILELDDREDLKLLLALAKRLNIGILEVKTINDQGPEQKSALMRMAATDPLFLADVAEMAVDFQYADQDADS